MLYRQCNTLVLGVHAPSYDGRVGSSELGGMACEFVWVADLLAEVLCKSVSMVTRTVPGQPTDVRCNTIAQNPDRPCHQVYQSNGCHHRHMSTRTSARLRCRIRWQLPSASKTKSCSSSHMPLRSVRLLALHAVQNTCAALPRVLRHNTDVHNVDRPPATWLLQPGPARQPSCPVHIHKHIQHTYVPCRHISIMPAAQSACASQAAAGVRSAALRPASWQAGPQAACWLG